MTMTYDSIQDYPLLLCLFNFIAPLHSRLHFIFYVLTESTPQCLPHTHTHTSRPHALQSIDELFMVLLRLRLASPEHIVVTYLSLVYADFIFGPAVTPTYHLAN